MKCKVIKVVVVKYIVEAEDTDNAIEKVRGLNLATAAEVKITDVVATSLDEEDDNV